MNFKGCRRKSWLNLRHLPVGTKKNARNLSYVSSSRNIFVQETCKLVQTTRPRRSGTKIPEQINRILSEGMDWVELAHDRVQGPAGVVKTVINLQFFKNKANSFTSCVYHQRFKRILPNVVNEHLLQS